MDDDDDIPSGPPGPVRSMVMLVTGVLLASLCANSVWTRNELSGATRAVWLDDLPGGPGVVVDGWQSVYGEFGGHEAHAMVVVYADSGAIYDRYWYARSAEVPNGEIPDGPHVSGGGGRTVAWVGDDGMHTYDVMNGWDRGPDELAARHPELATPWKLLRSTAPGTVEVTDAADARWLFDLGTGTVLATTGTPWTCAAVCDGRTGAALDAAAIELARRFDAEDVFTHDGGYVLRSGRRLVSIGADGAVRWDVWL